MIIIFDLSKGALKLKSTASLNEFDCFTELQIYNNQVIYACHDDGKDLKQGFNLPLNLTLQELKPAPPGQRLLHLRPLFTSFEPDR